MYVSSPPNLATRRTGAHEAAAASQCLRSCPTRIEDTPEKGTQKRSAFSSGAAGTVSGRSPADHPTALTFVPPDGPVESERRVGSSQPSFVTV
eukprot:CAMPEP_0196704182 /NCGR_PEP_ID=MMETSP1090-20130531/57474_1 /TAXON_ID=37098 /ORGANISM="Isochrysis sp, Strain CCMP1244" /LENGTH=92 /DNA_ID=CAMNT_0042044061 /DNA_START=88 /DNA_END=366 /DNA_ORIENTATION=-